MTTVAKLPLAGPQLLTPEPDCDSRGFFAQAWSSDSVAALGLPAGWTYAAYALNDTPLTLRGMHFQVPPHDEWKLVTCVRGEIHDVLVDVRPGSPTYRPVGALSRCRRGWLQSTAHTRQASRTVT